MEDIICEVWNNFQRNHYILLAKRHTEVQGCWHKYYELGLPLSGATGRNEGEGQRDGEDGVGGQNGGRV